jgi:hypothetical protein
MTTTENENGARGFAVILQQINEGTLHAELSEELQRLSKVLEAHANETGKAKGTLTLKLALEVDHLGVARIFPEVVVKEPKPLRGAAVFWLDKASNLLPENPKQTKLPLREVPKRDEPARDIGAPDRQPKSV